MCVVFYQYEIDAAWQVVGPDGCLFSGERLCSHLLAEQITDFKRCRPPVGLHHKVVPRRIRADAEDLLLRLGYCIALQCGELTELAGVCLGNVVRTDHYVALDVIRCVGRQFAERNMYGGSRGGVAHCREG